MTIIVDDPVRATYGKLITLTEPFPPSRLADFHHWLASYPLIARAAEFPGDLADFERRIRECRNLRTWAVWDRTDDLMGILITEPVGVMGARCYVASSRKAWGKGLLDEGARLAIGQSFEAAPGLAWICGIVAAKNAPANSFNQRVGMNLKNILPELGLLHYELTREEWMNQHSRTSGEPFDRVASSGSAQSKASEV